MGGDLGGGRGFWLWFMVQMIDGWDFKAGDFGLIDGMGV